MPEESLAACDRHSLKHEPRLKAAHQSNPEEKIGMFCLASLRYLKHSVLSIRGDCAAHLAISTSSHLLHGYCCSLDLHVLECNRATSYAGQSITKGPNSTLLMGHFLLYTAWFDKDWFT